ncbi:MAG: NUDIX domain-containing protein [Bdellovibrionales bacterium]|nr:NUDIX domain-containing protein [Bdellovibrionales bacterium]
MIDSSWYKKPDSIKLRKAAGGVIFRRDRHEIFVALVAEGALKKWILPKGGIDKGETVLEAAKREISEEAGISDLTYVCDLGVRERLNYDKSKWVTTTYFLFETKQIETKATDKTHDYKTEWFSIEKQPEMFWPEQAEILKLAIKELLN